MIEKFFPTPYHMALKFLATKDWITIRTDPEAGTYSHLHSGFSITAEDIQKYSEADIQTSKSLIEQYASKGVSESFFMMQVSKALAEGPKLFRPTMAQCEALEGAEIRVPFNFYQQPFSTVILEIPKPYQQKLREKYKIDTVPQYVISYKHKENNVVAVAAWYGFNNVIVNVLGPRKDFKNIEDAVIASRVSNRYDKDRFDSLRERLGKEIVDKAIEKDIERKKVHNATEATEFSLAEVVQRLGMNFSLMMTLLGVRVTDPLNTTIDRVEKQKKLLRKGSKEEKYRADRLLTSTVFLTKFKQEVNFYENNTPTVHGETGKTHRSPRPHYRHGYFRMQHYGRRMEFDEQVAFIGAIKHENELWTFKIRDGEVLNASMDNIQYLEKALSSVPPDQDIMVRGVLENRVLVLHSFKKLVFINEKMVNDKRFKGNVSDTSVTYTAKER